MKTRTEYMNSLPKYGTPESLAAHRAYYAQFVTPYVKQLVTDRIGLKTLLASRDEHLNDIPLKVWDSFWVNHTPSGGMYITPPFAVGALLREAGEGNSASTGTCILKEAARQVIEAQTVNA